MRELVCLIALFLSSFSYSQTPSQSQTTKVNEPEPLDQVFSLNFHGQPQFSQCGLITRTAGNLTENISPSCMQSVDNLYYDSNYSLDRRGGITQYNLTPCSGLPVKGLWPFNGTDAGHYLVAFSSNSMYLSSGIGDCTLINFDGHSDWNLTQSAEMECVQANGFLYCTDGVDPPFYLNQVSSATNTNASYGKHIGTFRNRILMAGVAGSLTDIYLSGELNGADWTIPSVQYSTSAAIISINGVNDGLQINCLMEEYQNQYLIGRDYDTWALFGYSLTDFTLRAISHEIGCIQPKSVQEVNNQLLWISKRGIESLSGTQITPVSYYIKPTIDQIISATGNSRSKLINGNNFASGNFCAAGFNSCTSDTIIPGFVTPSTWSVTEASSTTFAMGSLVNVSTTVTGAVFITRPGETVFINAGAESNNSTNWNITMGNGIWTPESTGDLSSQCPISPNPYAKFGSYAWKDTSSPPNIPYNVPIQIQDMNGNILISTVAVINNHMPWTETDITLPVGYSQVQVWIRGGSSQPSTMVSVPFVNGYNLPLWFMGCDNGAGSVFPVMDMQETVSQPTSGSYTSQCYDTALSTPTWGNFNVTISSNDPNSGVTFQTLVAKSCAGSFDPAIAATNGQQIISAKKEAIEYRANFTLNSSTNVPAGFTNGNLSAATTGYYITLAVLVSTPTSWGQFQSDGSTNGGSFTFWISTGATAAAATNPNANWIQQLPNTQTSVPLQTEYVAARVYFNFPNAVDLPILNDITFNWNEGSNAPPVSSMQYDDRYYLFYTTNTTGSPVNDHSVVYDYNGKWTLLDDVHAYSATLYLNQPFIGDSNPTGLIYQMESGQSDNGNPFTYSWTTGDLDFGSPAERKNFERLYLFVNAATNISQNISISCTYNLDGDGGNYPLQSYTLNNQGSGYSVVKFQFPAAYPTTGHWISITCNNTGSVGPISTYGLQLVYQPNSWE